MEQENPILTKLKQVQIDMPKASHTAIRTHL